jgi:hypothetical protein
MKTKIPLIPRRMNPAASGSELARITECNMSDPLSVKSHYGIPSRGSVKP